MSDLPENPSSSETPANPPPVPTGPTETGLPPNIAAALAEFFSFVGGVIFYFIERKNPLVRFHALQSAYFGALGSIFGIILPIVFTILAAIPIIGWFIGIILAVAVPLFGVVFFVVWVIAIISALQGKEWEIPWIGKLARKHLAEGLFFFVKSPAA